MGCLLMQALKVDVLAMRSNFRKLEGWENLTYSSEKRDVTIGLYLGRSIKGRSIRGLDGDLKKALCARLAKEH